jgi:hypothetical protein
MVLFETFLISELWIGYHLISEWTPSHPIPHMTHPFLETMIVQTHTLLSSKPLCMHSKCTFEAVQDFGDLVSAAAAIQVHRDNQDSHLQIKQTCIRKQSWLHCENMGKYEYLSYQSSMANYLPVLTKLRSSVSALILKIEGLITNQLLMKFLRWTLCSRTGAILKFAIKWMRVLNHTSVRKRDVNKANYIQQTSSQTLFYLLLLLFILIYT